jgi:hypothetical protein
MNRRAVMMRIKSIGLFVLMLWLSGQTALAQCSQCKAAAGSTGEDGELLFGNRINSGVLYLLAMPVLLPFIVGGIWYYQSRKRRRAQGLEGV